MTVQSRRKPLDVQRLAEAVSQPGIDPRAWVAAGRIDNDPVAIRFDLRFGWVADVTLYGGPLDQEPEIACRILSAGPGGQGFGEYIPPRIDGEVLVAVTDGDPNSNPVLLGMLSNEVSDRPPAKINGLDIDPALKESGPIDAGPVSPFDTELKRSPHNRREHYDRDLVLTAREIVIEGEQLTRIRARNGASIRLEIEGGGKLEIIARGACPIVMTSESEVSIDAPEVKLADGSRPFARVNDVVMGSVHALCAAPGAPLLPNPFPVPGAGVPFAAKIVSGGRAKG